MLTALILLTALLPSTSGTASPEVQIELEVLEAPSIQALDRGEVTYSRRVSVPAGDQFHYKYEDPRDGHAYRISFTLTPRAEGVVGVALSWRDITNDSVRLERSDLAVDGRVALSLYPLPEGNGETFLRLALTPDGNR